MSGLLLDSNVLLWWLEENPRLTADVLSQLTHEPLLMVSIVSPWELWIKSAAGRLTIPADLEHQLSTNSIAALPITVGDARLAAHLPPLHRDPFDRIIIAQALNRGATVVTSDRVFRDYGVSVLGV